MKKFIVTFGATIDDEYQVLTSKPIEAEDEQEAEIKLKDQFESLEGEPCTIISVKNI